MSYLECSALSGTPRDQRSFLLHTGASVAIKAFVEYYNYQRYREGIGNVTPYDVYTNRYHEILRQRKEAKNRTLQARKIYNDVVRRQGSEH